MLVADQEFCNRVKLHGPLIEVGPDRREEAGGDSKEGHVLQIGVMVEAVACNVVCIVVALPPCY